MENIHLPNEDHHAGGADPAGAGMNPSKPQLFTDSFQLPPRKGRGHKLQNAKKPKFRKPKARRAKVSKPIKKTTRTKRPKTRVEPTPEQLEERRQKRLAYDLKRSQTPERKERRRRNAQARRDEAKHLGLCVDCGAPPVPEQTRCETCAANHRVSRRQYQKRAKNQAVQEKIEASGQTRFF